jgi:hypothetical protein
MCTVSKIFFHVYSSYFLFALFSAALHIACLLGRDEGEIITA